MDIIKNTNNNRDNKISHCVCTYASHTCAMSVE